LAADITLMWWMRQTTGAGGFVLATSAVSPVGTYSGHNFSTSGSNLFVTTGKDGGAVFVNRRSWNLPGLPNTLDDTWRHVAITFKNGGEDPANTYLNGVLTTVPVYVSGSATTIAFNSGSDFRANVNWEFDDTTPTTSGSAWGEFADFRAYSSVLTAARILAIANGTA